jgi:phytoene dehydrogenase-like protein
MVEGGSLDFVKAIEKRYKSLGGDIKYKATVEKILVEDNRAVGVQLTDGSTHRADIIVSAADGRSTIFGMLEGKYINNKIKDRYADWKTFRPIIQACYGVAREFPGEPSSQVVKLAKPLVVAGENRDWIFLRIFNFSDKFAPQGKTALGVIIETQWDYWKSLREKDRDAYNKEKERISAEVLDRLEMQYPGLSSQVEVTDISTPYTTWRHTLNHRGAFEGFLITPQNVYSRVEKSLPGLDNFYMAGQWVMPGGGVVPCLFSGRHVIQLQCRKDGKSFREAR